MQHFHRSHPLEWGLTPLIAAICTLLVIPIGRAETTGGLTGKVLKVTSLAAEGAGSLRAAIEAKGPRLIVFEVAGVIDLQGRTLLVRHPFATIAGQTAPDPGITLIRGGLMVETHDVIVQHLAVRPGDGRPAGSGRAVVGGDGKRGTADAPSANDRPSTTLPVAATYAPDALGAHRGKWGPVHDVVFEHCSATWGVDENLSASGPGDPKPTDGRDATAHHITMRYCLIAEALSRSTHPKGEHSKGTLIHDGVRDVTIIGSLFAHNRERNPRFKGGASGIVRESLMYNWGSACVGVGARGNDAMLAPAEVVLAGNVAIAGPDTRGKFFVKSVDPGGRVAMRDNILLGVKDVDAGVQLLPGPSIAVMQPWEAARRVLRMAGSRPARRDPIDARIVRSVIGKTGKIIDSQEEVGGYPVRPEQRRTLDVPENIEARRQWLERLSRELSEDATLDLSTFVPSPGSRK